MTRRERETNETTRTLTELTHEGLRGVLRQELVLLDEVVQIAAVAVLHEQVDVLARRGILASVTYVRCGLSEVSHVIHSSRSIPRTQIRVRMRIKRRENEREKENGERERERERER